MLIVRCLVVLYCYICGVVCWLLVLGGEMVSCYIVCI